MHYLLSHRTSYSYASTVDSAQHIAHLRARPFPGQAVSAVQPADRFKLVRRRHGCLAFCQRLLDLVRLLRALSRFAGYRHVHESRPRSTGLLGSDFVRRRR